MTEVKSILPPSASSQERAIEQSTAGAERLPVETRQMWNADTCPENLLPWLAWALSVDDWDSSWDESVKRAVIRESVHVHRKKGTRSAVERALSALGTKIVLEEWFEDGSEPHTFKLTALANNAADRADGEVILDPALYDKIKRNVDNTKPARSHYALRVGASFETNFAVGGAIKGGSYVRERANAETHQAVLDSNIALGLNATCASVVRLSMILEPTS